MQIFIMKLNELTLFNSISNFNSELNFKLLFLEKHVLFNFLLQFKQSFSCMKVFEKANLMPFFQKSVKSYHTFYFMVSIIKVINFFR